MLNNYKNIYDILNAYNKIVDPHKTSIIFNNIGNNWL